MQHQHGTCRCSLACVSILTQPVRLGATTTSGDITNFSMRFNPHPTSEVGCNSRPGAHRVTQAISFNPHPTSEVGCNLASSYKLRLKNVSILTQPVRLGATENIVGALAEMGVSILTQPVRLGATSQLCSVCGYQYVSILTQPVRLGAT